MSEPVETIHQLDAAELRLRQAARDFRRKEHQGTAADEALDSSWLELRTAGREYGRLWLEYVRESPATVEVVE